MKLSIMSYCYSRALASGALDLQGMLAECARLGADVELMRGHAEGLSDRELAARLQDAGVSVPVLLEPAAIEDPNPERRAAAAAGLEPTLRLAAALGTPYIMVLPHGVSAGAPDADVRRWIGDGLARACELARGTGVRLIVENHGGAARLRGRVDHLLEFCQAAPDLGLCYDVGNFFLAGEDLMAAYERLAPRVVHVHCKDWRNAPEGTGIAALDGRRYIGAVIGEGVVPMVPVLERLARDGFAGAVSVEYEGPEDPLAATARATLNLRGMLGAA